MATRQGTSALRRNGRRGPEILLTLDLEGRQVEARWHVFELGLTKIQEGMTVDVRVDAEDSRIVYPSAEWAELSMHAQLGAA